MHFIKLYFKDPWILVPHFLIVFLQVVMWWKGYMFRVSSSDQVFLHYTSVFGVDMVGGASQIYYIPLIGIVGIFVVVALSLFLYRNEQFLARLLVCSCFVMHLVLVSALWFIVGLNL